MIEEYHAKNDKRKYFKVLSPSGVKDPESMKSETQTCGVKGEQGLTVTSWHSIHFLGLKVPGRRFFF